MKEPQQDKAEFDRFAGGYRDLIKDPIRDRFAADQEFFFRRKLDVFRDFFRSVDIDMRRLSWLDVGCGQGDLLRMGKPLFAAVAGCDPSDRMLESCSDLQVRQQGDAASLPYEDAAFDFVTAVCVYHHVSEAMRPALTREVIRVLRPGGIACVVEHNPLNPVTQIIVRRSSVDADAHLLSARRMRNLLTQAGAAPIRTSYFLLFPESIHRILSVAENALRFAPFGGQYSVFARRDPQRPGETIS